MCFLSQFIFHLSSIICWNFITAISLLCWLSIPSLQIFLISHILIINYRHIILLYSSLTFILLWSQQWYEQSSSEQPIYMYVHMKKEQKQQKQDYPKTSGFSAHSTITSVTLFMAHRLGEDMYVDGVQRSSNKLVY